jgi:hypothetical protein
MPDAQARIRGGCVRFEFRAKRRIRHTIDLHDPRLARIIKACRDLPGQDLFQYVDAAGRRQVVGSADVNACARLAEKTSRRKTSAPGWAACVPRGRSPNLGGNRGGRQTTREQQDSKPQELRPSCDPRRVHERRHDGGGEETRPASFARRGPECGRGGRRPTA